MHLLLINLKGDHTSHKGNLNRYSSVYYQLVITIWANGGSNLHMHNGAYYLIVTIIVTSCMQCATCKVTRMVTKRSHMLYTTTVDLLEYLQGLTLCNSAYTCIYWVTIMMTKETAYILVGSILPTNHCFIGKLTATGWVW